MPDLTTACCRHCVFSAPDEPTTQGTWQCRLDAPVAGEDASAVWPLVKEDDWCGHFVPDPVRQQAEAEARG